MAKNIHAQALGRKGGQSTSPAKKAACRANVAKARKAKQDKRESCPHGLTDSRQCGECAVERRHVILKGDCPHGLNDPNQCGECCVEAGF